MRLTVLGCSGSGPGPASPASGYLLTAGDVRLLLDLGNGSFGALQRHLDPWLLDGVVLSHLHADHCADMTNLVVHRRYHPAPPLAVDPLPVFGPADTATRLALAYAASPEERESTDLSDVLAFRKAADGGAVGDVTVRTALVELAQGADVLLCEASWPHVVPGRWTEPPGDLHMSGRQAGEHAAAAGVGRLLLTHIPAWCDPAALLAEARAAFAGPVEVVAPDVGYEV